MSTQFRAGDRVEVHGMDVHQQYNGLMGTVTGEPPKYLNDKVAIKPDSNSSFARHSSLVFPPHNLRLIESHITAPQKATEFKVGDRVMIVRLRNSRGPSSVIGQAATITHSDSQWVKVSWDTKQDWAQSAQGLWLDEIELLSPSSPQPNQTNKPKEDPMKPYVVIYHNLSTVQFDTSTCHATEAEAKESAERLAAGERSQVTKRTFFTITIINTKTGELVGSVTDAPPALDWKKQCLPS